MLGLGGSAMAWQLEEAGNHVSKLAYKIKKEVDSSNPIVLEHGSQPP